MKAKHHVAAVAVGIAPVGDQAVGPRGVRKVDRAAPADVAKGDQNVATVATQGDVGAEVAVTFDWQSSPCWLRSRCMAIN